MGFLSSEQAGNSSPTYSGIPIQTSVSTLPIPVVWGTVRIAPNLIWYGDFTQPSSSSGKGSSKGKGGNSDYTASIEMAICEGPIDDIGNVFKDQSATSFASTGFGLLQGYTPEPPWSYLSSAYPSDAYGYNGTAVVCAENYDLGASPTIPNHSFQVDRYTGFAATWVGSAFHAVDLALVIQDFLTNAQYGVLNYPSSAINTATLLSSGAATTTGDAALQTYQRAIGIGWNIGILSVESGRSILQRWLQLANCAAVWSGNALKFIPYGDQTITANGVTYLPNLTPVYALNDDDFVADDKADPVQVSRTDPLQAYNVVRIEVTTNDGWFSNVPVEARDQSAIEQYGLRIMPTITGHEITSEYYGGLAAQLILQRGLYIRNTFTFKLGIEFSLLEPMDLVEITDANLGLNQAVVRITGIEEDEDGTLTVTAEEFPQGLATAVAYPKQQKNFNTPDAYIVPDPANTPVIFEPTALMVSTPAVWMAVSGGSGGAADPNWGGCQVWVSVDGGTTYDEVGVINGVCKQGLLTATLPLFSGTDPDTTHTLAVSMALSGEPIGPGSTTRADKDITLCYVDGEILAYGMATLSGTNAYNITYLQRGLYGTGTGAHSSGTQFARLTDAIFKYPLPQNLVGVTLMVKFVGFNLYGEGLQDIAGCTAYSYTPSGVAYTGQSETITPSSGSTVAFPPAAQALVIGGSGTLASLAITLPPYPADRQQAQFFATVAITAFTIAPNAGQTVSYAPTTLAANTGCTMTYQTSTATWLRTA
jgi:hypothetical protein